MSAKEDALKIISRISGIDQVKLKPDMDLVGHLGFDSAKALELLVDLEDELGVEFGDEDVARMNTVGDILTFLEGSATA